MYRKCVPVHRGSCQRELIDDGLEALCVRYCRKYSCVHWGSCGRKLEESEEIEARGVPACRCQRELGELD